MLKPILLSSLIAIVAPAAEAGDWSFGLSFHKDRRPSIRIRYDGHRSHHDRDHRVYRDRHVDICRDVWVRGRFERVRREVVIPARYERRFHPAEYKMVRRGHHGRRVRVLVRAAHHDRVLVSHRRVETRYERQWVPGFYRTVCSDTHHRHGRRSHDRRRHRRGRRHH